MAVEDPILAAILSAPPALRDAAAARLESWLLAIRGSAQPTRKELKLRQLARLENQLNAEGMSKGERAFAVQQRLRLPRSTYYAQRIEAIERGLIERQSS